MREVFPGTRRYTQHTIFELAETIRERDIVTYEHCRRVAIYANRLYVITHEEGLTPLKRRFERMAQAIEENK